MSYVISENHKRHVWWIMWTNKRSNKGISSLTYISGIDSNRSEVIFLLGRAKFKVVVHSICLISTPFGHVDTQTLAFVRCHQMNVVVSCTQRVSDTPDNTSQSVAPFDSPVGCNTRNQASHLVPVSFVLHCGIHLRENCNICRPFVQLQQGWIET